MKNLEKVNLSRVRISDQIKNVLKGMILDRELEPGAKLPPEAQIAKQLHVSKVTVREALRDLETDGLLEKRRGVHGGSFVAHPGSEKMGEWVINYFRIGAITPEELVDFRQILEPALVALAVERRNEKDLRAIEGIIGEIEEGIRRGRASTPKAIEFHRLVGEACHNRLISMVLKALANVFEEILAKIPLTLEDAEYDLEHCRKIHQCLVQRKKKMAQDLMVDHFKILAKIIERGEKSGPTKRGSAGSE
jgi:DNA-binding FadR family transcriptional regulator